MFSSSPFFSALVLSLGPFVLHIAFPRTIFTAKSRGSYHSTHIIILHSASTKQKEEEKMSSLSLSLLLALCFTSVALSDGTLEEYARACSAATGCSEQKLCSDTLMCFAK
jgi:hypothetical protein